MADGGRPSVAVFGRDPFHNRKTLYAVTGLGRLAQIWDTDRWNLDFPAELAGAGGLRFGASPGLIVRELGNNKKAIYAVTVDGRLAQFWDTDRWNHDFPAELSGRGDLRFKGSPESLPGDIAAFKKFVKVLTRDGQIAQMGSSDRWRLGMLAHDGLRFSGSVDTFAFQVDLPAEIGDHPMPGVLGSYAITTDGRLAQISFGRVDFPAELAGHSGLRFAGSPAVFGRHVTANKKSLYALTTDGRLAQIWDTDRWNLDFPAEIAGHGGLRFAGSPAVFGRDAGNNRKSLYAITTDGRLAQIWDTDRWNLDFPAEIAGHGGLRFAGSPAVFGRDNGNNRKTLYAITTDGRLAQIWDADRWNLDFPAELAGHGGLRFQA